MFQVGSGFFSELGWPILIHTNPSRRVCTYGNKQHHPCRGTQGARHRHTSIPFFFVSERINTFDNVWLEPFATSLSAAKRCAIITKHSRRSGGMADALDSKSSGVTPRAGSSPAFGTMGRATGKSPAALFSVGQNPCGASRVSTSGGPGTLASCAPGISVRASLAHGLYASGLESSPKHIPTLSPNADTLIG